MTTKKLDSMIRTINTLYGAGNFNECLQKSLKNFNAFMGVQSSVIKIVIKILSDHHKYLTATSFQTVRAFRESYRHNDSFAECMDRAIGTNKDQASPDLNQLDPGQSCFPVAGTTDGAVYLLEILDTRHSGVPSRSLTSDENHLLDIIGAVLFSYYNQQNSSDHKNHRKTLPYLWNPSSYTFTIKDSFGKEVNNNVEGSSMGLAMLISLASLISGQPVPICIASTARIDRNGQIRSVESMEKKLTAIKTERDYITRILISNEQQLPENHPEFEYVRVKNISDVMESVFENTVSLIPSASHLQIDLKEGINIMEGQYIKYIIDTCISNCYFIIDYIENAINSEPKKIQGTDIRLEYLFCCYWKLGACYCHKGNINKSEKYLKKAEVFFDKNKSSIDSNKYYNFKNNLAVLLKDIFRYEDAEKVHVEINQDFTAERYLGKNLSSLSQLYLAQHQYEKAKKCQKDALKYIETGEHHRNHGYITQIYTRMGDFKKAEKSLEQALTHIDKIQDTETKTKQLYFYHWIESEHLYRKVASLKRKPAKYYDRFTALYKEYETIAAFPHGLINKFCGLGMLLFKKPDKGLQLLEKSEDFFDKQNDPMMALLGVTVRVEKISAWYKFKIDMDIKGDVQKVIDGLSVNKDIKKYFTPDIKLLEKYISNKCNSVNSADPLVIIEVLNSITHKIPY
ncbi:MAG: tetratricopeptide repeat protein [Desulfamplus sp.]|nr:tetratricopeptide repeat protein [Desulfamplus sp.]